MASYRKYNKELDNYTLEERKGNNLIIRILPAHTEEERKQRQSIDIYNILMHWIKNEPTQHPEQLIMAKILKDRNETELLYSLVVNA